MKRCYVSRKGARGQPVRRRRQLRDGDGLKPLAAKRFFDPKSIELEGTLETTPQLSNAFFRLKSALAQPISLARSAGAQTGASHRGAQNGTADDNNVIRRSLFERTFQNGPYVAFVQPASAWV